MMSIRDWQLIYSTLATSLFTDGISSIHRQHFVYSQTAFNLFPDSILSILCRLVVYSQTTFCLFTDSFLSILCRLLVYSQTAFCLFSAGFPSTRRRRRVYTQTAPCLHADGAVSTAAVWVTRAAASRRAPTRHRRRRTCRRRHGRRWRPSHKDTTRTWASAPRHTTIVSTQRCRDPYVSCNKQRKHSQDEWNSLIWKSKKSDLSLAVHKYYEHWLVVWGSPGYENSVHPFNFGCIFIVFIWISRIIH